MTNMEYLKKIPDDVFNPNDEKNINDSSENFEMKKKKKV